MRTGPSVVGTGCQHLTGWGWGVALRLQQRRSLVAGPQVREPSCTGDEGEGIGPSPGALVLQGPGSRQFPVSGTCFPRTGPLPVHHPGQARRQNVLGFA